MALEHTGPRGERKVTFVEALGKGGFGAVYLADVHGEDNFVQRIAVKVLNEEHGDEPEVVARQRDEARILAQINHDHIVKVFDLSEIHGRPAVFMEYVAGIDAGRLLQAGAVQARPALEIAAAVASALDGAWSTPSPMTGRPLHVVHRDIKPSNILISEHGGVKVLDFGIARAEFEREGKTRSHQFGTARYMSPEQWLGGPVGPAVDVYALGITLVEMLSGMWTERLPLMEERFELARRRLVRSTRDPLWGPVWWRELSDLLMAMLSMHPTDRPGATEVEEVLLDLSERAGGESLGRMARRVVPELMSARRQREAAAPLVSATDTWHHTAPEPSIMTGSKQLPPAGSMQFPPAAPLLEPRRLRDSHAVHWAGLVFGLVLAVAWMVYGWMGVRLERSSAAEVPPVPAEVMPAEDAPVPSSAEAPAVKARGEARRTRGPVIVMDFDSVPSGARVTLDGKRIGTTPLRGIEVPLGAHRLRVRHGKVRGSRPIDVSRSGPTRYTWHRDADQWTAAY